MPIKAVPLCASCVCSQGRPLTFPDTTQAEEHLMNNPTHYLVGRGLVWEDE